VPSDLPTTVEALLDAAAREVATADQVDVTYDAPPSSRSRSGSGRPSCSPGVDGSAPHMWQTVLTMTAVTIIIGRRVGTA